MAGSYGGLQRPLRQCPHARPPAAHPSEPRHAPAAPLQLNYKLKGGGGYFGKRAVIMSSEDKAAWRTMNMVHALSKEKSHKAKVKKAGEKAAYEAKKAVGEAARAVREKAERNQRHCF